MVTLISKNDLLVKTDTFVLTCLTPDAVKGFQEHSPDTDLGRDTKEHADNIFEFHVTLRYITRLLHNFICNIPDDQR